MCVCGVVCVCVCVCACVCGVCVCVVVWCVCGVVWVYRSCVDKDDNDDDQKKDYKETDYVPLVKLPDNELERLPW